MMKFSNKKFPYIILLLLFSCAYYNTFFNAQKFFKEAEKEREKSKDGVISNAIKQKYDNAIGKASRLLEFYPNSKYVDDALFLLGKSFFYKTEYRKAKRKFEELINNFPRSEFVAEASLWLGKTNTHLRDYETAEQNFRDILKGKAKRNIIDEAQFLLGGLYFHKEDYVLALNEYRIAAQRAKDKVIRSNAYYQMGECFLNQKDFAAAASSFEKARKYSPDAKSEFRALFKAGLAKKDLQQYDSAIDIFTELLGDFANEENWPQCKLEIADCLYLKGEIANAISWYESITEEHKKTDEAAKAYYNLGYIHQLEKSDYKQAKEYYDLAVKEYSRSEIVPQAKANSKVVQNLIALRVDIKEQEKRIAAGDSVAAAMDSIAVDTSTVDLDNESLPDSLQTTPEDTSTSTNFRSRKFSQQNDSTSTEFNPSFDKFTDDNKNDKNTQKKVALKTGKLGTPKEELIKDKLMLAEIYLFEFNQPDSALFEYLDILEKDTTVEIASKAVYSIGYIFENFKKDSVVADSIYEKLIEGYPNTIYAEKAREKLNLPRTQKNEDVILNKFKQAEKQYFDYNNSDAALLQYKKIADDYPDSEFASKSLFAMGWIYDNYLNENDKALEIYQRLLDNYPDTDYTKKAKKKIDEVNKQKLEKEKKSDSSSMETQEKGDKKVDSSEQVDKTDELAEMDKESYRKLLRKEMEKDKRRTRNPKRIIK